MIFTDEDGNKYIKDGLAGLLPLNEKIVIKPLPKEEKKFYQIEFYDDKTSVNLFGTELDLTEPTAQAISNAISDVVEFITSSELPDKLDSVKKARDAYQKENN